jgi:hypothetical protein
VIDLGACTGEMFEWWILFCDSTEKFRWWHPECNLEMEWDPTFYAVQPVERGDGCHIGHTMYIKALMNGSEYEFQLEFLDETHCVVFEDYESEDSKVTCFLAANIKVVLPVLGRTQIGQIAFQVRCSDEINELRTRIWLGDILTEESSSMHSTAQSSANAYLPRCNLFPFDFARVVHKYVCESMFCLRTILPGVHSTRAHFYKRNMIEGQYEREYISSDGVPIDFFSTGNLSKRRRRHKKKIVVPVDIFDKRKLRAIDKWRRNAEKIDKRNTKPWREYVYESAIAFGSRLRNVALNPSSLVTPIKQFWFRITNPAAYAKMLEEAKSLGPTLEGSNITKGEGQQTGMERMMELRRKRLGSDKKDCSGEGVIEPSDESEELKDEMSDRLPRGGNTDVPKNDGFDEHVLVQEIAAAPRQEPKEVDTKLLRRGSGGGIVAKASEEPKVESPVRSSLKSESGVVKKGGSDEGIVAKASEEPKVESPVRSSLKSESGVVKKGSDGGIVAKASEEPKVESPVRSSLKSESGVVKKGSDEGIVAKASEEPKVESPVRSSLKSESGVVKKGGSGGGIVAKASEEPKVESPARSLLKSESGVVKKGGSDGGIVAKESEEPKVEEPVKLPKEVGKGAVKKKQIKVKLVQKVAVERPALLEGWVEKKTHGLISTFQKRYVRVNENTKCLDYCKRATEIDTASSSIFFSMISKIEYEKADNRVFHIRVPDGEAEFMYTFRAGTAEEATKLVDGISSWREYLLRISDDEYREIVAV